MHITHTLATRKRCLHKNVGEILDVSQVSNPAANIPLPVERAAEQRYLDRGQVLTLADLIGSRYRALVLLGGFGPLSVASDAAARVDWVRAPDFGLLRTV